MAGHLTRGWIAGLSAVGLLTGIAGGAPAADLPSRRTLQADLVVTGYALAGTPTTIIEREAPALDIVSAAGIHLNRAGNDLPTPDAAMVKLLDDANANHLPAELLVGNFDSRTFTFNSVTGARLLRNPDNIEAVTDEVAGFVDEQGWDGVTVDLEALHRRDAPGLVEFVKQLQAKMLENKTVSLALGAATTRQEYMDKGFDIRALGLAVDRLALMAYDLHGPSWSGPGPIGPVGWTRTVLKPLLEEVDLAKIDLGVAGYGYTWPKNRTGKTVTVAGARRLVEQDGATARFVQKSGEWRAVLSNGTVLWWSDRRSWNVKVRMALNNEIGGMALWRLGSADSIAD